MKYIGKQTDNKDIATKDLIPTVGNGTITITQGGVIKGSFTTNQSGTTTIDVDSGSVPIVTRNVEISSADWISGGPGNYNYSADIAVEGVTNQDMSIVIFDVEDADSGDFASMCDTTAGTVTIYSKAARYVKIPVITTIKTNAVNPVFGNNDWETIKTVCQSGDIPASWAVGDTKTITGKDNNTYHIRLSDKQANRYDYSNSSLKTHAVFEFVELPNIQTVWNTSDTNVGGFADSQLRKNLNGLAGMQTDKNFMTQIIPDDLAVLLEEVNITTATDGTNWKSSKVSTSANKLFVPTYINVKSTAIPQYVAEGSLWDYYETHTSANDRKKSLVTNLTSYQTYWTASPYSTFSDYVGSVYSSGNMGLSSANSICFASPCFAF